eukprot:3883706-Rhodomonas_salina.2
MLPAASSFPLIQLPAAASPLYASSSRHPPPLLCSALAWCESVLAVAAAQSQGGDCAAASTVSYTHLTLPTICSV